MRKSRKPSSPPKHTRFANAAIDALGGTSAVARMFGVDPRVVCNWRNRGLPATHYMALAPTLAGLGLTVPPQGFGQRVIPARRASQRITRRA